MRIAATLGVLLLLSACQPAVVRTETRFIPPTGPEQLACIGRCDQADRDCLDIAPPEPASRSQADDPKDREEAERIRREYDECSRQVQSEYEQCEMRARNVRARGTCYKPVCLVKGKLPSWQDDPDGSRGTPDAAACARIYRACYQRCGGRVETTEICEGDC